MILNNMTIHFSKMQVIYSDDLNFSNKKKSIFLAGPTPRSSNIKSWRPDAIKYFESIGYNGIIFVPEDKNQVYNMDYNDQIKWEEKCLNEADCILFWIPRSQELPGFTTNIEWGTWCNSGKVVIGFPKEAPNTRYLSYYAKKYNVPLAHNLFETINLAINNITETFDSLYDEAKVPSYIRNTSSFQSWIETHRNAGNKLLSCRVLYNYRIKNSVFLWILKASIYIATENRIKDNEFVLARPDIVSVMMWYRNKSLLESEVVIVKEFRTPSRTLDGYVRELPGGSSFTENTPSEVAIDEVKEETGFILNPERLILVNERQLMSTLSSHTCKLYMVDLTLEEIEWFRSQMNISYGNIHETEKTYIEIHKIKDLINNPITDWSTLGQILSVINK